MSDSRPVLLVMDFQHGIIDRLGEESVRPRRGQRQGSVSPRLAWVRWVKAHT
jgi:hypothetical protein